jgi:hypothetical protein
MVERTRPQVPAIYTLPAVAPAPKAPAPRHYLPEEWSIRPAPSTLPVANHGWLGRLRLRTVAKNLDTGTTAIDAGARFISARDALERAQQLAEITHEARRSVPIVIQQERVARFAALAHAAIALDRIDRNRHHEHIEFEHAERLAELRSINAGLRLEAETAEITARLDEARCESEQRTKLAAEDFRLEMLQRDFAQLELVGQIQQRIDALRRARPASGSDAPEAFHRHYAANEEALRSRSEAQRRIDEIFLRAAAERRPLTDDEIQEVDAIADADRTSQAEIRRGAASDL